MTLAGIRGVPTVYPQVFYICDIKIFEVDNLYQPDFTNRFNDKRLEKRGSN